MSIWRALGRFVHGLAVTLGCRGEDHGPDLSEVTAERIEHEDRSKGRRTPVDDGEAYCTDPVRPAERPLSGPEFGQIRDPWRRLVNAQRELDADLDALLDLLAPLYLIGGDR